MRGLGAELDSRRLEEMVAVEVSFLPSEGLG
jgi:hypothetical protein